MVGPGRVGLRFLCISPLDPLERALNGQYLQRLNTALPDTDLSRPDNRGPRCYLRSTGPSWKLH